MTAATAPALAADLDSGLRRLKLGTMRRMAPELMITAKTQRWSPEEFLRTLRTPRSPHVMSPTPAPG